MLIQEEIMGTFLELFARTGGLTLAVQKVGSGRLLALALQDCRLRSLNLANDEDFEFLLQQVVDWFHAAPRCLTLIKAQRADGHAIVKVLRSDAPPQGFGCAAT